MNSIMLQPQIEEMYKLQEFIHGIISKKDFEIDLITEEIFVNIVNYSDADFIKVDAHYENSTLTIDIMDNGIEFNPLLKEDPKMPDMIEEAKIGGLGIHLTKELSDELDYKRINDENHLKIIKKVE